MSVVVSDEYYGDTPEDLREYYDEVFYQYSDCEYCGLVSRGIVNRGFGDGDYKCPQCNRPAEFKMELVKNVYGNIVIEEEF